MRSVVIAVVLVGCYTSPPPSEPTPIMLHPVDTGESPSDAGPLAVGTAGGGDLVVLGNDVVTLEADRVHAYDRICVQDQGRIAVGARARIEILSDRTTVIGGAGIGAPGSQKATIELVARGNPEIFVLFDNARAPIDAVIDAPNSTVHVAITGKAGLHLGGRSKSSVSHGGWGVPPSFPSCDASMDRDPDPQFPPSAVRPGNCVGSYTSSNYVTPQPGREELHIIGVYEGRQHTNGVVDVNVPARRRAVVLALTAYQPTVWRINAGAKLAEVHLFGYEAQRIEGIPAAVPVKRYLEPEFVCAYGWEPSANTGGCYYKKMVATIRKATRLTESSYQGCYAGAAFDVP